MFNSISNLQSKISQLISSAFQSKKKITKFKNQGKIANLMQQAAQYQEKSPLKADNKTLMIKAIVSEVKIESILNGKNRLSDKKTTAIWKNFQRISDERGKCVELLNKAKSKEASMQVLAHWTAYYPYSKGDILPGIKSIENGKIVNGPSYIVDSMITDNQGFQAIILRPSEIKVNDRGALECPPLVLMQGTVFNNSHDLMEDLDENLGAKGMDRNQEEIKEKMRTCMNNISMMDKNKEIKKPTVFDIAGHSLGGNRAQRLAARYPHMTGNVFTFQSPGIGNKELILNFKTYQELTKKRDNDAVAGEDYPIHIRVCNEGDVVLKTGGDFLPPAKTITAKPSKGAYKLTEVHSEISLLRDDREITHSTEDYKKKPNNSERVRKKIGPKISWLIGFFKSDETGKRFNEYQMLSNQMQQFNRP